MNGPVVLRLYLHRYRYFYYSVAAVLMVMAVTVQLFGKALPDWLLGVATTPFALVFFGTLVAFANPEADLAGEASGYPPFMLRLPVKTWILAAWPMIGSVLWGSAVWLVLAIFCIRPLLPDTPILFPVAVVAAIGITFQAIIWIPVKFGAIRQILSIIVPIAMLIFTFYTIGEHWSEASIIAVFSLEAMLAACVAIYGVTQARTTSVAQRTPKVVDNLRERPTQKAFADPVAAQVWVEWRKQGRILPILTGLLLFAGSLPLFFQGYRTQTMMFGVSIGMDPYQLTCFWALAWIPLLISTILGFGALRSYLRSESGRYDLFFATRALSNDMFLRAKYQSMARAVGMTAGVVAAFALVWLLYPIKMAPDGQGFGDLSQPMRDVPLLFFALQHSESIDWQMLFGVSLLGIAFVWRNLMVGAAADFAPFPSARGAYASAVSISGVSLLTIYMASNSYFTKPEHALPVTVGLVALLGLKVGAATLAGRSYLRLRPTDGRKITRIVAIWAVIASIAVIIATLVAKDLDASLQIQNTLQFPNAALIAMLLVPLARPIAAHLMVEMGRHRE